jgi:hypothetical protein
MKPLDDQQQLARDWFEALRTRICTAFEEIEREAGSDAAFKYTPWGRIEVDGSPGGGGVRSQMNGRVFEKVGVNVSTVGGRFNPEFAASIPGTELDPSFFATGISLVAHMANPHVPAVHMNCRFLTTAKRWFGGGADLNPAMTPTHSMPGYVPPAPRTIRPSTRVSRNGPKSISGCPTATWHAASAAFSSIAWKIISTSISLSPAMSAKRFSRFSRRWYANE